MVRCLNKEDEIVLLEYTVSIVGYVNISDENANQWDVLLNSIIPNYSPTITTEADLAQQNTSNQQLTQ